MKLNYDHHYGIFLHSPNRFIAYVAVLGQEIKCHVPNTGRLRELLNPGVPVMVSYHPSPSRKTQYELRMVMKGDYWVSIDSQLPNSLAYEAITMNVLKELSGYSEVKREVSYQNSRFDLQLLGEDICFVEVKGVTLERDGWSYFPDAPTLRGKKHIEELVHAVKNGYRGVLLFVIQLEAVNGFSPNSSTDPDFAKAIKYASENGVELLAYRCFVSPEEVFIAEKVPVVLN